eukprot:m.452370 g.452370  ORF g.452370 m.452370 type:complete len:1062 (+) comp20325_c5_seq5:2002-5187(+)
MGLKRSRPTAGVMARRLQCRVVVVIVVLGILFSHGSHCAAVTDAGGCDNIFGSGSQCDPSTSKASQQTAHNPVAGRTAWLPVDRARVKSQAEQYVVMLTSYFSRHTRKRLVQSLLRRANPFLWKLVPRHNLAATRYPSDFCLIQSFFSLDFLPRQVQSVVRSVAVDRVLHKRLKHATSASLHPGRRTTCWNPALDNPLTWGRHMMRALYPASKLDAVAELNAEALWQKGILGEGVRVGIFDTGLASDHPHFTRVVERTDWTDEHTLDDGVGHGTFVAGLVGSTRECRGFAPKADLYIFRVFTNKQVSFTSWFLDAFNYAMQTKVHVVNLSIGGPDFRDLPFVQKVNELTAQGVVLVSAIGNDGPLFGTLNNPGDQNNVIGVGGINRKDEVAAFSSRGMTTWELPFGYGRIKPDVVAYGSAVLSSHPQGGCRALSGTSVASPVVAGAVALLSSVIPENLRPTHLNPASVKQALMSTATRLKKYSVFEQGMGKINLLGAAEFLRTYEPMASIFPPQLDMTDCPFMSPLCEQPVFYGSIPLVVNLTVLNGLGVTGHIVSTPAWRPNTDNGGDKVDVSVDYSSVLWPWSGWLSLRVSVRAAARSFSGTAEGIVSFTVESTPHRGKPLSSLVTLPIRINIVPRPPRRKRLLWDQFHSLAYPSGYFPRDDLKVKHDPLDWNADHPHTNFRTLFKHLRKQGFFVDVLGDPLTCFDARDYGALLIVDSEEEFFPEEISKLERDVQEFGLSVIVVADWYNRHVMEEIKFFDQNTCNWWFPETGGSNVPALNELLRPWDIRLSNQVLEGTVRMTDNDHSAEYLSGTSIIRFPAKGVVFQTWLNDQEQLVRGYGHKQALGVILGLYQVPNTTAAGSDTPVSKKPGRIVVFGDSNCFDDVSPGNKGCVWLADWLVDFAVDGALSPVLSAATEVLEEPFVSMLPQQDPIRSESSTLHLYSNVLLAPMLKRPLLACPKYVFSSANPLQQGSHFHDALQGLEGPETVASSVQPGDQDAVRVGGESSDDDGAGHVSLWLALGFMLLVAVLFAGAALFGRHNQRAAQRGRSRPRLAAV